MMTGDINAETNKIKDGYRVISDVTVELNDDVIQLQPTIRYRMTDNPPWAITIFYAFQVSDVTNSCKW